MLAQTPLSLEAQLRIRDQLHSIQIGLSLLREEMLLGDLKGADTTYAVVEQSLRRLADDEVLASPP